MFPAMQIFALQAKLTESAHAVLSQNFPLFDLAKFENLLASEP